MTKIISSDQMPRDAKIFFDEGTAPTPGDAVDRLLQLRLGIKIAPAFVGTQAGQAALLTIVNSAARTFRGGVFMDGLLDVPLAVAPYSGSLHINLHALGVRFEPFNGPTICIGLEPEPAGVALCARGYYGGVAPEGATQTFDPDAFLPAVLFSAALAISEVFDHYRGSRLACERVRGLNVWDPGIEGDAGPERTALRLPESLWVAGLGHLGQAALWSLGLLPYGKPADVAIFLQDYDSAIEANDSTSLLLRHPNTEKKTRLCASWLEARGFTTTIIEQRFGTHTRRCATDPNILLSGFDKREPRLALLDPGFDLVVDSGLGSTAADFTGIAIYTFPGPRVPEQIWSERVAEDTRINRLLSKDNYAAQVGVLGECGVAEFAGKAVGASFVGAATAALAVTQIIRRVSGFPTYSVIDTDLRALTSTQAHLADTQRLVAFPMQMYG